MTLAAHQVMLLMERLYKVESSSMLARVGDEHMGRFLREELQRLGVDTSHLITERAAGLP